jgi:glycosyltransferase involved in cell wall biosynthesis
MLTTSIAMATFNGGQHIRAQLDSLARQTVLPLELVVTDDGSSDDTLAILEDFAKMAPFQVFIHRNDRKLGYRANFLKCANLCRGDLIAFCDQDDIWDADKLSLTSDSIETSGSLLLYHTFRTFDLEQEVLNGPVMDQKTEVGSPWAKVYGLTEVFHRSLLGFSDLWADSVDNFTPSQPMAHDQWIYFLAHAFGAATYLPMPLVSYRQHDENLCGAKTIKTGHMLINGLKNLGVLGARIGRGRDYAEKRRELASHWEGLSLGAHNRWKLLEAIVQRGIETTGLAPPVQMIRYYQQLDDYYGARFRIFTARRRLTRLLEMLSLFRRGLYFRQGVRGLRDGAIDLIYGFLA